MSYTHGMDEQADAGLHKHVLAVLDGRNAHADFSAAIEGVPAELRGARPPGVEHSLWQLLEHLRIALWDILEFSRDPAHVSPKWPAGYWPASPAPADDRSWDDAVAAFRADLEAMRRLVADPATDLLAPLAHGDGQTVLREALLVGQHNSYHLGQIVQLRRLLGAWPAG